MNARRGIFAAALMITVALLGVRGAWAIDASPELQDPALQARYKALAQELRCLKCQGETIADTQALFAADLRRQVRESLLAGQSDEQIRQFMVDRYGEIILLRPKWSARTAWLWLAPGLFLLGGVLVVWRVLKTRRLLLETDTEPFPDEEILRRP